MKKYIINFLAVFLAMTMLVSCGKAKKPTKSEKPKDNVSTQTEQIDDTTSDNKDNVFEVWFIKFCDIFKWFSLAIYKEF